MYPLLLSTLGPHLVQTYVCLSLHEFICLLAFFIERALFLLCSASSLGLTLFSPLPQDSLNPKRMGVVKTPDLGLCISRCHFLCNVSLCVSGCVLICCNGKLLWCWLSKTLISEHSTVSLGAIVMLCSFNGTLSGSWSSKQCGLHLVEWALSHFHLHWQVG